MKCFQLFAEIKNPIKSIDEDEVETVSNNFSELFIFFNS